MAQVQCDSSPFDCDDPFISLKAVVDQYEAQLNAATTSPEPTVR